MTTTIYCPPSLPKHETETEIIHFEIGYNGYNETNTAEAIEFLAQTLRENLSQTNLDHLIFRLAEKSKMYNLIT